MDNKAYAYQYLIQRGYSPQAAAGIIGNLAVESDLNAGAIGDNGAARGIAQWHPDRYSGLMSYAKQNNGSVNDLGTQLGYLDYELKNKYGDTFKKVMSANSPGEAAGAFALGYERPKGAETGIAENVAGWSRRLNAANEIGGVDTISSPPVRPSLTAPIDVQAAAKGEGPTIEDKAGLNSLLAAKPDEETKGLIGARKFGASLMQPQVGAELFEPPPMMQAPMQTEQPQAYRPNPQLFDKIRRRGLLG